MRDYTYHKKYNIFNYLELLLQWQQIPLSVPL